MNPELSLLVVGLIAKFLLRATLAFCVCLALNRLVTKAGARFVVWAVFLYGSAAYWLYTAGTLISNHQVQATFVTSLPQPSHASGLSPVWNVPQTWASVLGLVLGFLAISYGFALAGFAISHLNKLRRLRWVMGFTTEPPADVAARFHALAGSLKIRTPRLLMLSGSFSPATFGWLRPVVMLPSLCIEQDDPDLEDILLHELYHVHRRDALWNALSVAARACICFHPAAWYAMKKMRIERELACDHAVVTLAPGRKRIYAESLLRFARLNVAPEPATWGIDFAAPAQHLTVRVHSILSEPKRVAPWLLWLRTTSGLALLAIFVGVAPSLAILLQYTHPLVQFNGPNASAVQPVAKSSARRPHSRATSQAGSLTQSIVPVTSVDTAAPVNEAPVETNVGARPVLSEGPGPHLQRRSAGAGTASTKPVTIPLIDNSDSGHDGAHGSASQTLQQSATVAAAVWKRAGDIDHH